MLLKEVFSFGGLADASVAAGAGGLERPITSVSVLEVAEESISTWTMKDQLYITSFYAIRNDIQMQRVVVETLAKCKCCGLVICHIDQVLHSIDPGLIDLCDRLDFPLIVANPRTSFIDIINPIFSRLSASDREYPNQERIRSDFLSLITSDRSVSEILKIIAYKVGCEISFLDIHFNCLYSNKNELERNRETEYFQREFSAARIDLETSDCHVVRFSGSRSLVYYIKHSGTLFGFICIKYARDDTDETVLAVAESLNIPCALLVRKASKLRDVTLDYQQTFFADLLVWNFPSTEVALKRARDLGYTLQNKRFAIIININAIQNSQERERDVAAYIQGWFYPSVERIVTARSPSNIVHFRSDVIIILLDDPTTAGEVKALAHKLLRLFEGNKVTSVSIGISNPFSQVTDIPKAYNEAFDIAILGRSLAGSNSVSTFQEFGMLHYLKALGEQPHIRQLCRETILPLLESDRERGTELLHTAHVLLTHNMNISQCADSLHIHRNTLLYRKRQIQELMGYDSFALPQVLHFAAALQVVLSSEKDTDPPRL